MSANAFSPLVIFYKQLGDVLLLEPALAKLAATSGSPVMLATRPEFSPLLALMTDVRPVPQGAFRKAEQVVSFDPRSRACIQALRTFAPEKRLFVMADRQLRCWHRFFFTAACTVVDEKPWYRAEYFFRLFPGTEPFRPPQLHLPPPEWLPAGLPAGFVLVHATSAWRNKCWPAASWGQAITRLHQCGLGPFVITGGNAAWEREFVADIMRSTPVPILDLCGKTGLPAYLATVAAARLVLCIDGSAAHLAAALGRRSVVMFGPSHPLHWHYPAPHTRMLDARCFVAQKRPPVSAIPVDALVDAALSLHAETM